MQGEKRLMNIHVRNDNHQFVIALEGWLDTIAAPSLGDKIDGIQEATSIILDFDKVEYIASSGVRQIVYCYRKAKDLNADFSVINVNAEIMSIIQLTGIDKKIKIESK